MRRRWIGSKCIGNLQKFYVCNKLVWYRKFRIPSPFPLFKQRWFIGLSACEVSVSLLRMETINVYIVFNLLAYSPKLFIAFFFMSIYIYFHETHTHQNIKLHQKPYHSDQSFAIYANVWWSLREIVSKVRLYGFVCVKVCVCWRCQCGKLFWTCDGSWCGMVNQG